MRRLALVYDEHCVRNGLGTVTWFAPARLWPPHWQQHIGLTAGCEAAGDAPRHLSTRVSLIQGVCIWRLARIPLERPIQL